MCDRHTGIGADGLIVYEPTTDGARRCGCSTPTAAARRCRATACARSRRCCCATTTAPDVGDHDSDRRRRRSDWRASARDGTRQTFRAAMGLPADLRQVDGDGRRASRSAPSVLNIGNPQCVAARPAAGRGAVSSGWARRSSTTRCFPSGTNVEFAHVEAPDSRPDPDLGARRRADDVVGHRVVRGAGRGRGVRRRRARRRGHRAGRHAARRVARRQRLSDRLGRSALRRRVAPADSAYS